MALEFAPLPFLDAIAWARARQVVLPDVYYGELQGLARSMAFSVAGMAKLDQLQAVLDSLNGALEKGDSFASWKKIATDPAGLVKLDLPAHRVENIFRTNIQGHYGRGRCEQQKRNVESHPWYLYDAINDSRTRPTHAAMDGMVARHDDTIWSRWTPPAGYQSLLPDQPVAGSVEIGLKAWYAGPAVEIIMDSGARVRVTAQHPVLTTTGWVDASDLREGQNLLCYANQVDVIDPAVTANSQKQHPPLVAEQVFRALATDGVITVPRAAFHLNGDLVFIQGDVDVVTANRSLMGALQAGIREMLDELGFKGADPRMVMLPGNGSGQAHSLALGRIVPRRPGFFGRHARMFAQKIRSMMEDCGTYGVQFDPVRFQVAGQPFSVHVMGRGDGLEGFASEVTVDDIGRYRAAKLRARDTGFLDAGEPVGFLSGALAPSFRDVFVGGFGVNAETGRDILDAHPGLIKADQIVNVRRFEYVGHVYDFQCSNGLIVAQGGDYLTPSPIISNCRCRRIALTEKQAARFIEADTKRLRDPEAARARVEAQPDPGWDYNPCAEPDEGLRRAWAAKVGKVHPLLAEAATQAATMPPAGPPAWTILEGDQATLDEIKRLGGERLDEFMAMVTPDDGAGMTTLSGEPISIKAFMGQPAGDVLRGYFNGDAIMPWLRAQMLDRLRAVRSVGGAAFKLENKSGKGVALSKRVSDKFPTSWVEKVNAAGAPYRVTVKENGRGWHSAGSRKIQTSSRSTAEHEWTHAVQAADPVLDALFQDEHRRRTVGEALEWLGNGYGASEKARRDHYVTAYQGKEYDARGALEVITMAMQAVLGDDRAANEWFQGMVKRDPEMLKLALGALFHYRPKL